MRIFGCKRGLVLWVAVTVLFTGSARASAEARNPFRVPAPLWNAMAAQAKGGVNGTKVALTGEPRLKGIVTGQGKRYAIIEYQGLSKTYSVGDLLGASKISEITASSVRLSGSQQQILKMEAPKWEK